MQYTDCAKQDA